MSQRSTPYRFLNAYDAGDSSVFFARDEETEILLADVVVSRLVVVFAKTGTGKTSLINAGVRPKLIERGYETFFIRVRRDPEESAREALREHRDVELPDDEPFARQLEAVALQLGRSANPAEPEAGPKPIVLFFDQFEEFFLYVLKDDPERARRFIAEIASVHARPENGVHIVLSLREDFFVDLDVFRDVIPNIFHRESNLRLRWFNRRQARRAIIRPAVTFGATVERALVSRVVDELTELGLRSGGAATSENPIEPAQLQIVCDTLWRENGNGALTLDNYLAHGDRERHEPIAEQIIERRLREEFGKIQAGKQLDLLERLLGELHTPRGTKRVRDIEELREATGADASSLEAVLEKLEEARLVTVAERGSIKFVELTHDYLVERLDELRDAVRTIWPRRILERAVTGFRERGTLLSSTELSEVAERLEELVPSPAEAEVILRSALADPTAEVPRILACLEERSFAMWEICEERLHATDDVESAQVVQALAKFGHPNGLRLLERAVAEASETAHRVLSTLGDVWTIEAVEIVAAAIDTAGLRPQAQVALARLTRAWGNPDVARRAVELLTGQELETDAEEEVLVAAASQHAAIRFRVVPLLSGIEQVRAVELLADARRSEALAAAADEGLRALARSTKREVSTAAEAALAGSVAPPVAPTLLEQSPVRSPPEPFRPMGRRVPVHPEELDKHIRAVVRAVADGRIVFFLGAGVNLVGRPPGSDWQGHGYLPSGAELARYLADRVDYPLDEPSDLARVAQYVAVSAGEGPLYDELRRVFAGQARPTEVHRFLASLPALLRERHVGGTLLLVSMNFDDLLERAFADADEPCDVVSYMAVGEGRGKFVHRAPDGATIAILRPNEYDRLGDERPVVLKLAGSVGQPHESDSFVISEDDYLEYLTEIDVIRLVPATVAAKLRLSSFLFLGYGLRDWNVRALLHRLWRGQELKFRSWAIMRDPSPLDQAYWQQRGVDILDVWLEEYVERLSVALDQL